MKPVHSRELIPELNGIRGLAILLVLVFHLGTALVQPQDGVVGRAVSSCWIGVDLFFALSGFLITGILLDAKGKKGYFTSFYWRRTLRIFPLYYSFVILFFGIAVPLAHSLGRWMEYPASEAVWYLSYLSNWHTGMGAAGGLLTHFWSLAVEEQFYLCWPLLIALVPFPRMGCAILGLVSVAVSLRLVAWHQGWPVELVYRGTAFRLDPLALGALVAWVNRGGWRTPAVSSALQIAAIVSLTGGVFWVLRGGTISSHDREAQPFGYLVIAIACAGFVSAIVDRRGGSGVAVRTLRSRGLQKAGELSYGIYVWHVPLAYYASRMTEWCGLSKTSPSGAVVFLGVTLLGSFGTAALTYALIERPFLRLKNRQAPKSTARDVDSKGAF